MRQVFGTRKIKKCIWNLLAPQAYEQYLFVSRMSWNSQVNGQILCSACAMTFILVSVLYKHVCECIDDPFATPVTDATLVSEVG